VGTRRLTCGQPSSQATFAQLRAKREDVADLGKRLILENFEVTTALLQQDPTLRVAMVRQSFAAMTRQERARVMAMTVRRSPTPGGRVTG
jgi:hypothetical protein